jgi:hypothetical protein
MDFDAKSGGIIAFGVAVLGALLKFWKRAEAAAVGPEASGIDRRPIKPAFEINGNRVEIERALQALQAIAAADRTRNESRFQELERRLSPIEQSAENSDRVHSRLDRRIDDLSDDVRAFKLRTLRWRDQQAPLGPQGDTDEGGRHGHD